MMFGLTLAAALAAGVAQDAGVGVDGATRAEACGALQTVLDTQFPDGETAPPEYYVARTAARDRCIAAGGSGPAFYYLNLDHSIAGRRDEARQAIEAALALDPDNPEYLFVRGVDIWEDTQAGGGADIDRALRLDEPSREIYEVRLGHQWVFEALEYEGRHEAILLLTTRLIETGQPSAGRHLARGLALATLGQPEAGLADVETALTLNTTDLNTSEFLAAYGGQYVRARILQARSLLLARLGRGLQAVADVEAALQLAPRHDDPVLALASCRAWIETGDRAAMRRACDLDDDEWQPALRVALAAYRGLAFERSGQSGPARRAYARALAGASDEERIGLRQAEAYAYQDGLEMARAGLERLASR